jgi:exosortase A-associated hydrolase 2
MPAASDNAGVVVEPFFLSSPSGRIFAVHHRPRDGGSRGHVLVVPPFNEEANRCRSMVTLLARALASIGVGVLVVDLYGTGDSAGEYRDARWSLWIGDVQAALAWLADQPGGCAAMLGIRLGAILAAQVHQQSCDAAVGMVLWQPVVDGKLHLNQFLRVRMAAQLDRPDLPKETTATMRHMLEAGSTLEVAGYELHPELVRAIDAARLTDFAPKTASLVWLDHVTAESPDFTPATARAIETWRAKGVAVQAMTFTGPMFWQVHERVVTPSIIAHTQRCLEQRLAA